MPKNLVICCDGTNNQFGPENTNVVRVIQALVPDPARQRLYYDPGVGTLPEPGAWTALGEDFDDRRPRVRGRHLLEGPGSVQSS